MPRGVITTFDVPGASPGTTKPASINPGGQVVGTYRDCNGRDCNGTHGFVRSHRASSSTLTTPVCRPTGHVLPAEAPLSPASTTPVWPSDTSEIPTERMASPLTLPGCLRRAAVLTDNYHSTLTVLPNLRRLRNCASSGSQSGTYHNHKTTGGLTGPLISGAEPPGRVATTLLARLRSGLDLLRPCGMTAPVKWTRSVGTRPFSLQ
jgi:hypothetical protein